MATAIPHFRTLIIIYQRGLTEYERVMIGSEIDIFPSRSIITRAGLFGELVVSVIYTHPGFDVSFVIAGTTAVAIVGVITTPLVVELEFLELSIKIVLSGKRSV